MREATESEILCGVEMDAPIERRGRSGRWMEDMCTPALTLESKPNITDIRYLEERIYEFNVQATGISDGLRFGIFLRGADGVVVGGIDDDPFADAADSHSPSRLAVLAG